MTSAALAALVHVVVVAGLFLLPGTADGGDGLAATAIPVTLVEPVIEEPPMPGPAPEPQPVEAPPPEPVTEPAPAEDTAPPPLSDIVETPEALAPPTTPDAEPVEPDPVTPSTPAPPPPSETAEPGPGTVSLDAPKTPAPTASPEQASASGDGRKQADGSGEAAMTAYLTNVRKQLMRHAPKAVPGARDCTVEFRLSHPGTVTAASLRTSSGSPRYDRRCLQAVHAAAPFPPAPDSAPEGALFFRIEMRQRR